MKNNISSRSTNIIISFCIGFTFWVLLTLLATLVPEKSALARVIQIMGGSAEGYIQMFIYIAFTLGILEVWQKERYIKSEYQGFNLHLLPVEHEAKLTDEDVSNIGKQASQLEKHGEKSLLASFIQKACSQYGRNQSFADTMQVIDSKITTCKAESESKLEIVRFVLFAISSLGFVGTVIGLAAAISQSANANSVSGMESITRFFYLAFDTTLVALVLNLILNYVYHRHLERLDTFFSESKSYLVDNLVCKIQPTVSI